MHEILVYSLGGLSLPRKSVARLIDRPDMTIAVYHGRETKTEQHNSLSRKTIIKLLNINEINVPYFFGYKTDFSFENNPKDLDLYCKMDLDLWDCLGRVKLVLLRNFIGLI